MTEPTGAANAWGEAWLDSQRKYFDTWMDLTRRGAETLEKGFRPEAPPANPFVSGLDQWWKMMAPALPEEGRQVAERLLDMNKGYMQMGEQIWSMAQGMQSAMKAGQDWQENLQEQIKQWQGQWNAQKSAAAGWNTLWGLPLQHWRQLSSSYSMMPGDVEKALHGGGPLGADTLSHALKGALSTPAVGYTREMQEDWQEWARLGVEHMQVVQKYEALLMGVGNHTVERIGARMMAMAKEGKGIDSLRQAYDLWVDCAEDAYAELARSAEFQAVQAQLTNTLMAVKRQEQVMVEQAQSVFNLPTRTEMNTAHERIHGLRREVRKLRHQLEDSGVEELHQKLDALRAEVRALTAAAAAPGTAPAAVSAQATVTDEAPRKTRAAAPKTTTEPKK